jgi:hypothetical protein
MLERAIWVVCAAAPISCVGSGLKAEVFQTPFQTPFTNPDVFLTAGRKSAATNDWPASRDKTSTNTSSQDERCSRSDIDQCNLMPMTHPPVLDRVATMARGMPSFQRIRFRFLKQQDYRNERQNAETEQDTGEIADGTMQRQPRCRSENPVQRVNKLIHGVPLPWMSS